MKQGIQNIINMTKYSKLERKTSRECLSFGRVWLIHGRFMLKYLIK